MGLLSAEVTVDLVLLLGSTDSARALGPCQWAALEEVAAYLSPVTASHLEMPLPTRSGTHARLRPTYRLWWVSTAPDVPPRTGRADRGVVELDESDADQLWGDALDRRSRFDVQRLGTGTTRLLSERADVTVDYAIVVTDAELVPPSEWRYILWGGFPGGAVVSTAPMDPRYWGASMADDALARRQQVKHGTRASVMSVVGSRLGLSRCDNPSCFMFAAVDNVARLAEMRTLGDEHGVIGLARGTFHADDPEPEQVAAPSGSRAP